MQKVFFLLLFFCGVLLAQPARMAAPLAQTLSPTPDWANLLYTQPQAIEAIRSAYAAYYKTHLFVKNQHTQAYKRWLRELSRDVDARRFGQSPAEREAQTAAYLQRRNLAAKTTGAANWTCIGPIDFDKESAARSYAPGAAHVYTVEQSRSNPQVVYAGTATAGVWKSVDKGLNWLQLTEGMMITWLQALEIHPQNPDTVWFGAEGKLWKTTDGGISWNSVGDTAFAAKEHNISDIVYKNNLLYVASSKGLFVSADGGMNFTQKLTADCQEIEFHPTNAAIVYAVLQVGNGTQFWKSADGGQTYAQQTNGWAAPAAGEEQKRTEIAVTPAAPDKVVAYCTGVANGGSGLYGIYVSNDAGATWAFQCCGAGPGGVPDTATNINICGWDSKGGDDGGQYYYDLALEISPTDPNLIHAGAVNHWLSTDGGITWNCPAAWSHSAKANYVHADIHDIRYFGTDLWIACDGGIFYSSDTAKTFSRRQKGIAGTDFWGFGAGHAAGRNVMLGGTYHNGTLLKDNNVYENGWVSTDGGDGIRGSVNPGNNRVAYSDYGRKHLSGDRTVNNITANMSEKANASYVVGESSNTYFHPHLHNSIFIGKDSLLMRSDDNGASFSVVYAFTKGKVMAIEICPAQPDVMYVVFYPGFWDNKQLWKTTDGGTTWSDITPPISLFNGAELWAAFDIAVSGDNPDELWLARTPQYAWSSLDGYKIFHSTNGGTSWTNITTSDLDGEYLTNIEHQRGTQGGIYLGTRRAVYYRNNTMPAWELFSADLPAQTNSTFLQIDYEGKKLRNATNRSIWESDLYESSTVQAQISADRGLVLCYSGDTVHFTDRSVVNAAAATWQWTFPGGSPATSSLRNPSVAYTQAGTYSVYLTVSDPSGTDSDTATMLISVGDVAGAFPLAEGFENPQFLPEKWHFGTETGGTWQRIQGASGFGQSTASAYFNNFEYDLGGKTAFLWTPAYDFSNMAAATISFNVAYARYAANYSDSLCLALSTDCGATHTRLWLKGGSDLATRADLTTQFTPSATEWRLENIDISAFAGKSEVMIGFGCIGKYGNAIYVDDINLQTTSVGVSPLADGLSFSAYPNPTQGAVVATFRAEAGMSYTLAAYNALGQQVANQPFIATDEVQQQTLDLSAQPAGVYMLSLQSANSRAVQRVVLLR